MKNVETGSAYVKVAALRTICIKEVSGHMQVLEKQVWDLPASLIKDVLPHLNIWYLERIEAAARCKGVSTANVWASLWKDVVKAWRCRSRAKISADKWRQECLERLFHMALFGHIQLDRHYLSKLSWFSVLSMTAKHVQVLSLFGSAREICKLASDGLRPVLATLEKNVRCIKLQDTSALFKQGYAVMLYIFHRLLDHGSVRHLILTRSPDPRLLSWILQRSRCQSTVPQPDPQHFTTVKLREGNKSSIHGASACSHDTCLTPEPQTSSAVSTCFSSRAMDDDTCTTPMKRPRLDLEQTAGAVETNAGCLTSQSFPQQLMESECLFPPFTPSCSLNGEVCPEGQIHSLVIEVFKDEISRIVSPLLPSWLGLRSLHFHSEWPIDEADVMGLVEALRLLFKSPACSLADLSIGSVSYSRPVGALLLQLLTACPTLKSLSLEVSPSLSQTKCHLVSTAKPALDTAFPLDKLSVRFPQESVNLESFALVLGRAPSLMALHLIGIHCGHKLGPLLQSLPESIPNLKTLSLDDVNLANCHSEVLHFLNNSKLEDVNFKDCRLLEKCRAKEDFLGPFVTALKGLSSLCSLTLSHNRIGDGVIALADLFSERSCKIQKLDISSNYILPMGLLEFGKLLENNPPSPGLAIDLRCNPLDRDPLVTEQALLKLRPLCRLITDNWNSRTTMADHVSVM